MAGLAEKFRAFGEGDFDTLARARIEQLRDRIHGEEEDYILNANEAELVSYLASEYSLDAPQIAFDDVFVDHREERLNPIGRGESARDGEPHLKTVITYHLPFVGDDKLLRLQPNPRFVKSILLTVLGQCVCFELIGSNSTSDQIKAEAEGIMGNLKSNLAHLQGNVRAFNDGLSEQVHRLLLERKQALLKRHELVASLGVPIKRRNDLPTTWSIPSPQDRHGVVVKPVVTERGYRPEPTIDTETYRQILSAIRDCLVVMEQHPTLYLERDEATLRDHILWHLSPRFEWSVTGETFNHHGKTDILVRYETANLFVAECKFWDGQSKYLETITQLLGYLTWRDSKAAAIIFVKTAELSSVLASIEQVTPRHENCLGFADKVDDAWLNYRFHIIGDRNREVKLGVLVCHVPPV